MNCTGERALQRVWLIRVELFVLYLYLRAIFTTFQPMASELNGAPCLYQIPSPSSPSERSQMGLTKTSWGQRRATPRSKAPSLTRLKQTDDTWGRTMSHVNKFWLDTLCEEAFCSLWIHWREGFTEEPELELNFPGEVGGLQADIHSNISKIIWNHVYSYASLKSEGITT